MPIVTNHKGPRFREYSRTPTENKVIELENRIRDLEELLTHNSESADPENPSNKEDSTK